jgi:hypothetical protein
MRPCLCVLFVTLGLSACGGDAEESGGAITGIETTEQEHQEAREKAEPSPSRVTAADLRQCVEGAGLRWVPVGETDPEREEVSAELDIKNAKHTATIVWPDNDHNGDVFIAPNDDAAARAGDELKALYKAFGVSEDEADEYTQIKANVVFVPDDEGAPTADEAAGVDGCVPAS